MRVAILFYRYTFSAFLGSACRFRPTCSEYALEAVTRHGGLRGGWLAIRRLARCHPWGESGFDPVPDSKDPDCRSCHADRETAAPILGPDRSGDHKKSGV